MKLLPGSERQTVAVEDPDEDDDRETGEAFHQDGQDVFPSHHAAVKESEGRRHEHDESSGHKHPGRVAGVDLWGDSHTFLQG